MPTNTPVALPGQAARRAGRRPRAPPRRPPAAAAAAGPSRRLARRDAEERRRRTGRRASRKPPQRVLILPGAPGPGRRTRRRPSASGGTSRDGVDAVAQQPPERLAGPARPGSGSHADDGDRLARRRALLGEWPRRCADEVAGERRRWSGSSRQRRRQRRPSQLSSSPASVSASRRVQAVAGEGLVDVDLRRRPAGSAREPGDQPPRTMAELGACAGGRRLRGAAVLDLAACAIRRPSARLSAPGTRPGTPGAGSCRWTSWGRAARHQQRTRRRSTLVLLATAGGWPPRPRPRRRRAGARGPPPATTTSRSSPSLDREGGARRPVAGPGGSLDGPLDVLRVVVAARG